MTTVECRRGEITPLACYKHGCRAALCTAANTHWGRRARKLQAQGRWDGLVPADQARAHINTLVAQGMTNKAIAEQARSTKDRVNKIATGRALRVQRGTSNRILAVELRLAGNSMVDATGARRRVGALMVNGWAAPAIAADAGLARETIANVLHGRPRIEHNVAARIAASYDRLWSIAAPSGTPVEKRVATNSRKLARAMGHAAALAWDDDTIDDPDARPHLEGANRGDIFDEIAVETERPTTTAERVAVVANLTGRGLSAQQIAVRIGVEKRTVVRLRGAA